MITGHRKNHDLQFLMVASVLILAELACNLPISPMKPTQAASTNHAQNPGSSSAEGTNSPAGCLAGIIPGTTIKARAIDLLGDPVSSKQDGDVEYLNFPSSMKAQFNGLAVQNGVVGLVSVVLGEGNRLKWSEVKRQFGEPAKKTYSNYLQWSMTYIYPDRGLAFVASEGPDVVFIRECFVPMALEEYMNTWGKSLPTEDPYIE